jgi:acetyltransferase-like isoleucine patch superfamily enzyme
MQIAGDLTIWQKWQREEAMPVRVRVRKARQYLWSLLTARVYLRSSSVRGAHVRTQGRPRIENDGHLTIGHRTLLRSTPVPVELAVGVGATMHIGDAVRVNYGASIAAVASIHIGDRVRIGPYAMIVDSDFHELHDRQQRPVGRPVVIEDDVWIGAKASVLKGVRIGRGAVVGVGAVVTRDVPAGAIVAGVPARIVRMSATPAGGMT